MATIKPKKTAWDILLPERRKKPERRKSPRGTGDRRSKGEIMKSPKGEIAPSKKITLEHRSSGPMRSRPHRAAVRAALGVPVAKGSVAHKAKRPQSRPRAKAEIAKKRQAVVRGMSKDKSPNLGGRPLAKWGGWAQVGKSVRGMSVYGGVTDAVKWAVRQKKRDERRKRGLVAEDMRREL